MNVALSPPRNDIGHRGLALLLELPLAARQLLLTAGDLLLTGVEAVVALRHLLLTVIEVVAAAAQILVSATGFLEPTLALGTISARSTLDLVDAGAFAVVALDAAAPAEPRGDQRPAEAEDQRGDEAVRGQLDRARGAGEPEGLDGDGAVAARGGQVGDRSGADTDQQNDDTEQDHGQPPSWTNGQRALGGPTRSAR